MKTIINIRAKLRDSDQYQNTELSFLSITYVWSTPTTVQANIARDSALQFFALYQMLFVHP